jgi:hypothetical protein
VSKGGVTVRRKIIPYKPALKEIARGEIKIVEGE